MPIRFACPGCRARLNVPDDARGITVRCPKCRSVERVPSTSETVARAADDTDELPVTLFPSIPGDLAPVEKPGSIRSQTKSQVWAGVAWGAGFWLAGLAAAGLIAVVRVAYLWAVG
jgi:hypothetical protein